MERQKRRAERKAKGDPTKSPGGGAGNDAKQDGPKSDNEIDMAMSDDEAEKVKPESATPATPLDQLSLEGLKRKRDQLLGEHGARSEDDDSTPHKRAKSETPPLPPPPPAPTNGVYPDIESMSNEVIDGGFETLQNDPVHMTQNSDGPPSPPSGQPSHESPNVEERGDHRMNGDDDPINSTTHGHLDPLQV